MVKVQRSHRVTLRDVAAKVGVSPKTVSNVVNSQGWVSEPVRNAVLAAIEELGYHPNFAARQLRSGTSGMIALVVPNLREPYFAEFASSFVAAAQSRGLTVLVSQSDGNRDRECAAIEGHSLPGLDGIVLSPLELTAADLRVRRSNAPLVLIGEYGEALLGEGVPHVGIDNVAAARAATAHLISKGCRRIAAIGCQIDQTQATSRLRLSGYREALDQAGIAFEPTMLGFVERFNRAEGSQAVRRLIDSGVQFDGLFCFSDSMAFGAIHTLSTSGISVPDDVCVIGFDNIEEGQYSYPAFDTVDPAADIASNKILDLLANAGSRGSQSLETSDGSGKSLEEGHIEVPYRVLAR
ncbi:LacI family DNA-binding transcriptional regulator [Schaalia sp. JY-X159]|uniref:LacI family DNA-binding transcriptional regulator n=1 Tax=Schaalia sp. JY-X159 TaxID=2758575 RepID=UPI00165E543C|nr:LacI family DNA-binding transcriptional regulator [Schaalia sp. JY-X159]